MKKSTVENKIAKAMCKNHTGKMSGIWSLSTSPYNEKCNARAAIKGTVYEKCYSRKMLERYPALAAKLADNTELLAYSDITPADVPFINAAMFRFESFGDLITTQQVKNYFTIAGENSQTTFALWTKNPATIAAAMSEYKIEKPANIVIIYSNPIVNSSDPARVLDAVQGVFPFVDKLFTVYDKQHAGDVEINCGARSCATCRRCYSKSTERLVNEKLK